MSQNGANQDALNVALHRAIEQGKLAKVRDALAKGANPATEHEGETPLDRARYNKDEIRAELILAGAWQSSLAGALVWAVGTGNVELVRRMIENGADVNADPPLGTPVLVAARDGQTEMVDLLIAANADLDSGSILETPLAGAIENGHEEIALRLLEAGASSKVTELGYSHLAAAAGKGMERAVRWLIDRGVNLEEVALNVVLNKAEIRARASSGLSQAFDALKSIGRKIEDALQGEDVDLAEFENIPSKRSRQTRLRPEILHEVRALHLAAHQGQAVIVDLLLSAGADPGARDAEGRTAWEHASEAEYEGVLDAFARHGIEGPCKSPNDQLLEAAERGDVEAVRQALVAGAETSARDVRKETRSFTPLMLASRFGHDDVVMTLLEAGADPNLAEDRSEISRQVRNNIDLKSLATFGVSAGRTALIEASRAGHTEIVRHLLAAGADVAVVDLLDDTALVAACETGKLELLNPLLEARLQPTPDGAIALRVAIREGHDDLVDALLAAGVDISAKSREGENALIVAAERADFELVKRLLDRGADVQTRTREGLTPLICAAGASRWVAVQDEDEQDLGGIQQFNFDDDSMVAQTLRAYPETLILSTVKALLDAGADPNPKKVDESPLAAAVQQGHLQVMEVLLEAGAEPDRSAFENAQIYEQHKAQKLLRQYGDPPPEEDEDDAEDTWGPDLPTPNFSAKAETETYQAAVQALAERYESQSVPLDEVAGLFEIHVNAHFAKDFEIDAVQREWLDRGAFVYLGRPTFNRGGVKIRILPTTDPYEAIAAERTNGANYDIGPGYIVQWMQRLESEQPFVIHRIAYDTLAGRFLQPVKDAADLAERIYDFCPDTVDQGFEEVEALAEDLEENQQFSFWWD